MIKKSCNMVGCKAQLVTNKWKSHMLPSLDGYLYAKNLRYQFNSFQRYDDKIILQSDLMRAF